jgi:hypothetical protein
LLNEYISAFEQGMYILAKNTSAYNAHRATTMDMIWSGAQGGSHLPDEVAACAIAHRAKTRNPPPVSGAEVPKDSTPPKGWKPVFDEPQQSRDGDVYQLDDFGDVSVGYLA